MIDKDDEALLQLSIDIADANIDEGGGPFGAVVAVNGEVVAKAANRVVPDGDPTAHAEVLAIRRAAVALGTHDLGNTVLYSSCEPCPMCLGAVYWAGIRRVVYTATREDAGIAGFSDYVIYRELSMSPHDRSIACENHARDKGVAVFSKWERYPFKDTY